MKNLLHPEFSTVKTLHFTGIGGIGMSGLASLFKQLGFNVQGSDIKSNSSIESLQKMGINIFLDQKAENIKNADLVVVSSAISRENPEYQAAVNSFIPVLKRGKMLAELMRAKWGISVTGTHGKTTTTSLISHILSYNDLDPTAVIGGIVNSWGQNSRYGGSQLMIAESDESDGSFLDIPATIAVVTNIEAEHMEYYKTYDNLLEAFVRFVNQTPFYGFAVLCIDDEGVQTILPRVLENNKIFTYGISAQADFRAINIKFDHIGSSFDVVYKENHKDKFIKDVHIPMYGLHNVLNTLAGIVVSKNININVEGIKKSLLCFEGIKRRFTKIGSIGNMVMIDDYAHHPSEISAVLNAARNVSKDEGKIIAVVQPHRYTRLRDHFTEFSRCFNAVDYVIVMDVYPAGENPIEGFDSKNLAHSIQKHGHKNVFYVSSKEEMYDLLYDLQNKNEISFSIFVGAGSISSIAYEAYEYLKNKTK